ncbi:MAG: hypothetical protein IIX65_08545, partial [Lachnospiraceae bacterium]|nr:hypothetical protein [Lachnospiraceae bacterium]
NGNYIVSLASFEPYDDPNLFIMVIIDEPHVEDQSSGGYTTRLANAIWRDVIEYRYGVDLDPEDTENAEGNETPVPDGGEQPGGDGQNGENQNGETPDGEPSGEQDPDGAGEEPDEGRVTTNQGETP